MGSVQGGGSRHCCSNTGMAGPQLAQVMARRGRLLARLGRGVPGDGRRPQRGCAPRLCPRRSTRPQVVAVAGPPAPEHCGGQIILTSGTTGTPKGAHRAGPSGLAPAGLPAVDRAAAPGDVTHVAAPLFHAWGFAHFALAGLLGSTMVLRRRFDPEATLRLIEEHRVTVLAAAPIMLQRIMDLPESTRSALRHVVVAGRGGQRVGAARRAGDAVHGFRSVTCCTTCTARPRWRGSRSRSPSDLRAAPATAGRPPRGTILRLLDGDGEPVARRHAWSDLRGKRPPVFRLHRQGEQADHRRTDGHR